MTAEVARKMVERTMIEFALLLIQNQTDYKIDIAETNSYGFCLECKKD